MQHKRRSLVLIDNAEANPVQRAGLDRKILPRLKLQRLDRDWKVDECGHFGFRSPGFWAFSRFAAVSVFRTLKRPVARSIFAFRLSLSCSRRTFISMGSSSSGGMDVRQPLGLRSLRCICESSGPTAGAKRETANSASATHGFSGCARERHPCSKRRAVCCCYRNGCQPGETGWVF